MIKLYRFSDSKKEYWEAWKDGDGSYTVHWGEVGTRGNQKSIKNTLWAKASRVAEDECRSMIAQGFGVMEEEEHSLLIVEYAIDGMGSADQLKKRQRLEDRLTETLGWTGLGACDGGSIGSGTMEVCAFVVDFELAKSVIEADLLETEFADYARIYDEVNSGDTWA